MEFRNRIISIIIILCLCYLFFENRKFIAFIATTDFSKCFKDNTFNKYLTKKFKKQNLIV